jgi:hypothetical protein
MPLHKVSQHQVDRLQEMLDKNYPIGSLRFDPMEGHITIGVRVKGYGRGSMRYFFVGQRGQLK